jgi:NADPH:quinone reductase-like Zn-dependent oxidoreductase
VTALGPGARPGVCVGDRVAVFPALSCGTCRHCRRGLTSRCAGYGLLGEDEWGPQRELIAVPAEKVLRIADDLPLADAAAAPGAYTTAWTMVVTKGAIRPGERLLAVGATGGVSIAAMQIAAHAGAEIWATTRDAGKAKRLADLPFVHRVFRTGEPGWSAEILERATETGSTWSSMLSAARAGRTRSAA